MTIPLPENTFTAEELAAIDQRRQRLQAECPRHPGTTLEFWKELFVGTTEHMHLATTALYSCGDMATFNLDTDQEPTVREFGGPSEQ